MSEVGSAEAKPEIVDVPPEPKTYTLTAIQIAALRGALREAMEANQSRDAVITEILKELGHENKAQLEILDAFKGIVRIHEHRKEGGA